MSKNEGTTVHVLAKDEWSTDSNMTEAYAHKGSRRRLLLTAVLWQIEERLKTAGMHVSVMVGNNGHGYLYVLRSEWEQVGVADQVKNILAAEFGPAR